MAVAYLVSNNGKLNRSGEILEYSDYLGNRTKLIPDKLDEIMVIGRMELTGPALFLIMEHRIPVYFFHMNGRYNGILTFDDPKNVFLRHKQHLLAEDQEFVKKVSIDIVRGKLQNQHLFLQRIGRKLKSSAIDQDIIEFDRLRDALDKCETVDAIRGIEGSAARKYYGLLGLNIECPWVKFSKRSKNPPRDEVNAVLSFLYTVLANKVSSALAKTGLDRAIGCLHSMTYGRNSLVFDLMEEYRTPLVDTLACALFNQDVLKKEDFREGCRDGDEEDPMVLQIAPEDQDQGVYLTEEGLAKVINALEKKLAQEHQHPLTGKLLPYSKIIQEQVNHYKQLISGLVDHYQAMVVR